VIAVAEAGADAVLGPLVVSAVLFEPAALEALTKVHTPPKLQSNMGPQRQAWFDFVRQHATRHITIETSVNDLNRTVGARLHMKRLLEALEKPQEDRDKITIEDVVWENMVESIKKLEAPEGTQVALLVPPKDLRWGRVGDVRWNGLHALRQTMLEHSLPTLKFEQTPTKLDPVGVFLMPFDALLALTSLLPH
jgi:hypothetical protein